MITFLQIEPTTRCGLACPNCSREKGQVIRDLSVDTLERILAAYPTADTVKLQGLGEPFMHPELDVIAATCRAKGLQVTTTTNGQSDRIVPWARHFTEIVFSLDCISENTPKGAHGGDPQKTIRTILAVQKEEPAVHLAVNQVISATTRPQDIAGVQWFCRTHDIQYGFARIENWHAGIASLEVELDRKKNGPVTRRAPSCPWGYTHLYFDATGKLHPCCIRMNDAYGGQMRNDLICGRCPD